MDNGWLGGLAKGEGVKSRWESKRPLLYRLDWLVVYLVFLAGGLAAGAVRWIGLSGGWAFAAAAVVVAVLFSIMLKFYPVGPYDRWLRWRKSSRRVAKGA